MAPKRRFWKSEQSVACAFLKYFSRVWVLVLGYRWLKARSKTHTLRFVRPSKILRLGSIHFREIARPDWVGTLRRCNPTQQYFRFVKWPTQSGLAISRKCCFPRGSLLDVPARHEALRVCCWSSFQGFEYWFWATTDWKLVQKRMRNSLFDPGKFFVWGAYNSTWIGTNLVVDT